MYKGKQLCVIKDVEKIFKVLDVCVNPPLASRAPSLLTFPHTDLFSLTCFLLTTFLTSTFSHQNLFFLPQATTKIDLLSSLTSSLIHSTKIGFIASLLYQHHLVTTTPIHLTLHHHEPAKMAQINGFSISAKLFLFLCTIMSVYHGGYFIYSRLPAMPSIESNLKSIAGFFLIAHIVLAAPWFYLSLLDPIIGYLVPSLAFSGQASENVERRLSRYSAAAVVPHGRVIWMGTKLLVGFLYRVSLNLRPIRFDKHQGHSSTLKVNKQVRFKRGLEQHQARVEPAGPVIRSGDDETSTKKHLTAEEQQEAEARRCPHDKSRCLRMKEDREKALRDNNRLATELSRMEEREADKRAALVHYRSPTTNYDYELHKERREHRSARKALEKANEELALYRNEAESIKALQAQLAQSEAQSQEAIRLANVRADEAEAERRRELERSYVAKEEREKIVKKWRNHLQEVVIRARERIGEKEAEITALKRESDASKQKKAAVPPDFVVNAQNTIAAKDARIALLENQLTDTENDRIAKMQFAEAKFEEQLNLIAAIKRECEQHMQIERAKAAEMRKEVASLEEQLSVASAAGAKITNRLGKYQAMKKEQQAKMVSLETELTNAKIQVISLRNEVATLQEQRKQNAAQDTEVMSIKEQLAGVIEGHKFQMEQAKKEFQEQEARIRVSESNLVASYREMTSLREELSRRQQNEEAQNNRIASLEGQTKTACEEAMVLQKQIADMQNEAQETFADQHETIKVLSTQLDMSRQKNKDLNSKLVFSEQATIGANQTVAEYKFDSADLERQVVFFQEKLEEASLNSVRDREELAKVKKDTGRQIADQTDKIADLEQQFATLQAHAEALAGS